MATMYTRETFNRQRARSKSVSRATSQAMAIVAMGGGLAQLVLIRLLSGHLAPGKEKPFELAVFIVYIITVGFLVWRVDRAVTAEYIRCPQCTKILKAGAEDTAAATGKCIYCGGQVIG
jgi:hypothetical protein